MKEFYFSTNAHRHLRKFQVAELAAAFADATLVAIADRLTIRQIATYEGDFRVYRYRRRHRFATLLLADG